MAISTGVGLGIIVGLNLPGKKTVFRLTLLWTACLFMFPLIITQGIWVRRVLEKMPDGLPPNEGIINPDTVGSESENRPQPNSRVDLRIIGIGDSVIAGVGVEHMKDSLTAKLAGQLANESGQHVDWSSHGVNGDRAREVLEKVPGISASKVDLVVISVGVNDVSRLTSVTRWQFEITALIAALRERFGAPIVFLGLPPMGRFSGLPQPLRYAMGVRAELLDLMLRNAAIVIDDVYWSDSFSAFDETHVARDGYHPNERACEIGAGQILSAIDVQKIMSRVN